MGELMATLLVMMLLLVGAALAIEHCWPGSINESKWSCERFSERPIRDVPARCVDHFNRVTPSGSVKQ